MSIDESWDEGCAMTSSPGAMALMAAADGEADEATLAHLRGCPSCAAQVARIKVFQARLRRRLYRLYCPSSDALIDYCQGLLDPYQRTALVHHLAICPHCAAELALMERAAPLAEVVGAPARARLIVPLP
jgi:anti-sigma factor RsiW